MISSPISYLFNKLFTQAWIQRCLFCTPGCNPINTLLLTLLCTLSQLSVLLASLAFLFLSTSVFKGKALLLNSSWALLETVICIFSANHPFQQYLLSLPLRATVCTLVLIGVLWGTQDGSQVVKLVPHFCSSVAMHSGTSSLTSVPSDSYFSFLFMSVYVFVCIVVCIHMCTCVWRSGVNPECCFSGAIHLVSYIQNSLGQAG